MTTVNNLMLHTLVNLQGALRQLDERRKAEQGEGVISTAIAVLIIVGLGGAMWIAYKGIFDKASVKVDKGVEGIGNT
jgi:hypothetical protein